MDRVTNAELVAELLREAVLRYLAEPSMITPAQGGEKVPNPEKESRRQTMEDIARDAIPLGRVLGKAVERYSALCRAKYFLQELGLMNLDKIDFELLSQSPAVLRKVTNSLSTQDVPAEIYKAMRMFKKEG